LLHFVGYPISIRCFLVLNGLATIFPTAIAFFCAYYFDNNVSYQSQWLAAYWFIRFSTILFQNDYENNNPELLRLFQYFNLTIYSAKNDLKKHFSLVFLTFVLHIFSIACINNLSDGYWGIFIILMVDPATILPYQLPLNRFLCLYLPNLRYRY
jgi:hypothetical protein